jgi:hypothetical protein
MGKCISLLLAAALVCASTSAADRQHTGVAIDRNGKVIEVSGTAYIRVFPEGGTCPEFKGFIMKAVKAGDDFRFLIPEQRSSYGAVFCRNGYFSRIEPSLSNIPDGLPVQPRPLIMYAYDDKKYVEADLRRRLDSFVSELRYLRSIDVQLFNRTLEEWSGDKFPKLGKALLSFFGEDAYPE